MELEAELKLCKDKLERFHRDQIDSIAIVEEEAYKSSKKLEKEVRELKEELKEEREKHERYQLALVEQQKEEIALLTQKMMKYT